MRTAATAAPNPILPSKAFMWLICPFGSFVRASPQAVEAEVAIVDRGDRRGDDQKHGSCRAGLRPVEELARLDHDGLRDHGLARAPQQRRRHVKAERKDE